MPGLRESGQAFLVHKCKYHKVLTSPQLLQILLQLLHWMPCLGHGRHPYASTRCFIVNHRERLGKAYHPSLRGCREPFLPLLHLVHLVPSHGPPDRRKGSSRCRLQHQKGYRDAPTLPLSTGRLNAHSTSSLQAEDSRLYGNSNTTRS